MFPRLSVFLRLLKISIFFTTCISLYILVSMMVKDSESPVNVPTDEIQTEVHQRRLQFHYARILRNASLLQNPYHLCAKSDIFIVIYVHSAPDNIKRRMALRDTWANRDHLEPLKARTVFVMGIVNNERTMDAVSLESERYGDILQGNFLDEYKNLTLKALITLTWLSENCLHANYILKTDDDIVANIEPLTVQLRTLQHHNYGLDNGLVLCRVWNGMHVIRDVRSKWYVSNKEFRRDIFPLYCSGAAFIMSSDVVDRLLVASKNTAFLWVDDVYLTGLVLANSGVKHTRFNEAYAFNDGLKKITSDETNSIIFYHCPDLRTFFVIWKYMQFRQQKIKSSLQDEHKINSTEIIVNNGAS